MNPINEDICFKKPKQSDTSARVVVFPPELLKKLGFICELGASSSAKCDSIDNKQPTIRHQPSLSNKKKRSQKRKPKKDEPLQVSHKNKSEIIQTQEINSNDFQSETVHSLHSSVLKYPQDNQQSANEFTQDQNNSSILETSNLLRESVLLSPSFANSLNCVDEEKANTESSVYCSPRKLCSRPSFEVIERSTISNEITLKSIENDTENENTQSQRLFNTQTFPNYSSNSHNEPHDDFQSNVSNTLNINTNVIDTQSEKSPRINCMQVDKHIALVSPEHQSNLRNNFNCKKNTYSSSDKNFAVETVLDNPSEVNKVDCLKAPNYGSASMNAEINFGNNALITDLEVTQSIQKTYSNIAGPSSSSVFEPKENLLSDTQSCVNPKKYLINLSHKLSTSCELKHIISEDNDSKIENKDLKTKMYDNDAISIFKRDSTSINIEPNSDKDRNFHPAFKQDPTSVNIQPYSDKDGNSDTSFESINVLSSQTQSKILQIIGDKIGELIKESSVVENSLNTGIQIETKESQPLSNYGVEDYNCENSYFTKENDHHYSEMSHNPEHMDHNIFSSPQKNISKCTSKINEENRNTSVDTIANYLKIALRRKSDQSHLQYKKKIILNYSKEIMNTCSLKNNEEVEKPRANINEKNCSQRKIVTYAPKKIETLLTTKNSYNKIHLQKYSPRNGDHRRNDYDFNLDNHTINFFLPNQTSKFSVTSELNKSLSDSDTSTSFSEFEVMKKNDSPFNSGMQEKVTENFSCSSVETHCSSSTNSYIVQKDNVSPINFSPEENIELFQTILPNFRTDVTHSTLFLQEFPTNDDCLNDENDFFNLKLDTIEDFDELLSGDQCELDVFENLDDESEITEVIECSEEQKECTRIEASIENLVLIPQSNSVTETNLNVLTKSPEFKTTHSLNNKSIYNTVNKTESILNYEQNDQIDVKNNLEQNLTEDFCIETSKKIKEKSGFKTINESNQAEYNSDCKTMNRNNVNENRHHKRKKYDTVKDDATVCIESECRDKRKTRLNVEVGEGKSALVNKSNNITESNLNLANIFSGSQDTKTVISLNSKKELNKDYKTDSVQTPDKIDMESHIQIKKNQEVISKDSNKKSKGKSKSQVINLNEKTGLDNNNKNAIVNYVKESRHSKRKKLDELKDETAEDIESECNKEIKNRLEIKASEGTSDLFSESNSTTEKKVKAVEVLTKSPETKTLKSCKIKNNDRSTKTPELENNEKNYKTGVGDCLEKVNCIESSKASKSKQELKVTNINKDFYDFDEKAMNSNSVKKRRHSKRKKSNEVKEDIPMEEQVQMQQNDPSNMDSHNNGNTKQIDDIITSPKTRSKKRCTKESKINLIENDELTKEGHQQLDKIKNCTSNEPYDTMKSLSSLQCGICDWLGEENNWIDHIYLEHQYVAWKSSDTPLNLEDDTEILNHFKNLIKQLSVLKCSKCGITRKLAKSYMSHYKKCKLSLEEDSILSAALDDSLASNSVQKEEINELAPNDTAINKETSIDAVSCGVCKWNGNRSSWFEHIQHKHEYLAWMDGEAPLDFNNEEVLFSHLKKIVENESKLICKCGLERKYVKLYLKHRKICRSQEHNSSVNESDAESGPLKRRRISSRDGNDELSLKCYKEKTDRPVVCGRCKEQVDGWKWQDHMVQHRYIAWQEGEPPIDEDVAGAVRKQLMRALEEYKSLQCEYCGVNLSTIMSYQTHIKRCEEKRIPGYQPTKRQERKSIVYPTSQTPTTKIVKCAVCSEEMPNDKWKKHLEKAHYNMAWFEGAVPFDLTDYNACYVILNDLIKKLKQLVCNKCGEKRISGIGFYAHIAVCGKSPEEVEAMKVECSECSRMFMPFALAAHMLKHRQVPIQAKAEPEISSPVEGGRRRAAVAAKANIEKITSALVQSQQVCSCGYTAYTNEDMEKHKCPRGTASFRRESEDEASEKENAWDSESEESDSEIEDVTEESESKTDSEDESDEGSPDERKRGRSENPLTNIPPENLMHQSNYKKIIKGINETHFNTTPLFPELKCNDFEPIPIEDMHRYLPPLTRSCRIHKDKPRAKKNFDGQRLNLFECKTESGEQMIFTGGIASTMSFVPPQDRTSRQVTHHYLSVTCQRDMTFSGMIHSQFEAHPDLIQIWDFGDFESGGTAELALGIAHEHGTVWSLDWCPSGGWEETEASDEETSEQTHVQTSQLRRLGLMAAACSDGTVCVYAVCHPGQLPKIEKPIYKTKPVMELKLCCEGYDRLNYHPTAVHWSMEKDHKIICVGYSNGTVALYDLTTQSPLLRTIKDGLIILNPYFDNPLADSSISKVMLYPSQSSDDVCLGALTLKTSEMSVRMGSLTAPVHRQRFVFVGAQCTPFWPHLYLEPDEVIDVVQPNWLFKNSWKRMYGYQPFATCLHSNQLAVVSMGGQAMVINNLYPNKPTKKRVVRTFEMKPVRDEGTQGDSKIKIATSYQEADEHFALHGVLDTKWTEHINHNQFPLNGLTGVAFSPCGCHHDRLAFCGVSGIIHVVRT